MSPPPDAPAVAARIAAWLCAATVSVGASTGCVNDANPGVDPPSDQLFFPGGLQLDPRSLFYTGRRTRLLEGTLSSGAYTSIRDNGEDDEARCEAACAAIIAEQTPDVPPTTITECAAVGDAVADDPWSEMNTAAAISCTDAREADYLFVSSGNNDLAFNAATITAIDLNAFFDAWYDEEFGVFPYCEDAPTDGRTRPRCVLDRGSQTNDEFPCRRLALLPQVVECDEAPFVVDSVRVEDFVTVLDASVREPNGVPRLWAPVRGGPSITYIDVEDGPNGTPDLSCGQRERDGEADDEARCSDRYRLTTLRNDDELRPLDREPFNILIDEGPADAETPPYRYAYIAHSAGGSLTLVDLDGLGGRDPNSAAATRPAIVDSEPVFIPIGFTPTSPGGFGLAVRPCSTQMLSGSNRPNSPNITLGCQRPLVYGSYRFQLSMTSFTVGGIDAPPLPDPDIELDDCFDDAGTYLGPYCAGPEDLGKPCTILCEPSVVSARPFLPGGVDPLSPTSAAALGDIAFADETGTKLYAVQTNPGALLELDTSVDLDGQTLDIPAGPPIELCNQPTRMELLREDGLAFVSCFRAALLFVVDLRGRRVIETIVTGTGPHDLTVDEVRRKLYVTNSLEASVSIIELDPARTNYLREIARIGLQDPFSR